MVAGDDDRCREEVRTNPPPLQRRHEEPGVVRDDACGEAGALRQRGECCEDPAGAEQFLAQLSKPLKPSQLYDAMVDAFGGGQAQASQPVAKTQEAAMAERLPLRILLAEDNAVNQKLAQRLLAQLGYRSDLAGNGLEAIEALIRQPYDVVLMDVQMPELDGLEASRQICQRWPRKQRAR